MGGHDGADLDSYSHPSEAGFVILTGKGVLAGALRDLPGSFRQGLPHVELMTPVLKSLETPSVWEGLRLPFRDGKTGGAVQSLLRFCIAPQSPPLHLT